MLRIHVYDDETFCELNFRGLRPIRENRKNYAPQKFGAIRTAFRCVIFPDSILYNMECRPATGHTCIYVPAALFEPGILYHVLHDDPSVHHVSLPLREAVPPGRGEIPGHHEGEGRVGIYGGVVPLDVGTEGRDYVQLERLWELLVCGQTANEACRAGEGIVGGQTSAGKG